MLKAISSWSPSSCARGQRPRGRRAAEQRDEVAAFHSITPSAMASSPGGKLRLNALNVPSLHQVGSYLVELGVELLMQRLQPSAFFLRERAQHGFRIIFFEQPHDRGSTWQC